MTFSAVALFCLALLVVSAPVVAAVAFEVDVVAPAVASRTEAMSTARRRVVCVVAAAACMVVTFAGVLPVCVYGLYLAAVALGVG